MSAASTDSLGPMILPKRDAAKVAGISERTLDRMRETGDGPRYVRLGKRRIGYPLTELRQWLSDNTFRHRAEEMSRKPAIAA